ncbi:MAG: bifunctional precorrin-2 dehydrogenase/sirohydrochlorin ferrochelatase [Flavobacteriales bacterium]|nr:bifunctional precorrin-2 dehydrogenase/sirohydrochlorin ferrochelatase [Flavobacteriales bacterium]
MSISSDRNNLFPLFLKLEEWDTLIVGAGNIGLEKLTVLIASSPKARIKVVAEKVSDAFERFAIQHANVEVAERSFEEPDLHGVDMMILATNNKEVNAEIKEMGKKYRILTNVVDTPGLCDFYFGSIVNKKHLKIAISTNGKSPVVAKRLRQYFEEHLPDEMDDSIENLHALRDRIQGDLAQKAKALNDLTQILVLKEKEEQQN